MPKRWSVGAVSDLAELLDGARDDLVHLADHLATDPSVNGDADAGRRRRHLRQARARLAAARAYLLFLDGEAAPAGNPSGNHGP